MGRTTHLLHTNIMEMDTETTSTSFEIETGHMPDPDPPTCENRATIEYTCEEDLVEEFKRCMRDPEQQEEAIKYLYNAVLDETILGVVFEVHFAHKTGIELALEGEPEELKPMVVSSQPGVDVFGVNSTKISMDCMCPKCERSMAASRFAPHLEKCMGMGRNSSRIASRRIASTRDSGTYFDAAMSDNEDDADWSGEKRRKKNQSVRTNGNKKNGKSSS